jgi:hypothetical protein
VPGLPVGVPSDEPKYEHLFEPRVVRQRLRSGGAAADQGQPGAQGTASGTTGAEQLGEQGPVNQQVQARVRKWYQLLQVGTLHDMVCCLHCVVT